MKSSAFAPGHISGFFQPFYHSKDINRTGSKGAGINISLGAISQVSIENSVNKNFDVYINGKKFDTTVVHFALNQLLGNTSLKLSVKTKLQLPIGQGFGMSGASALSATLACAKIVGLSSIDALKASHFAEIKLGSGLGDVMGSNFGGVEIRRSPGLPPWGLIEHIPGNFEVVLCVIGKVMNTKNILSDKTKIDKIIDYGNYCTKKLLENPSIENFFYLSRVFAKKTTLANKKILDAINAVADYGNASMCMLGNSVFAVGETLKISSILSEFGQVYICQIDEYGARILDGA
jgi:pantoate kinase